MYLLKLYYIQNSPRAYILMSDQFGDCVMLMGLVWWIVIIIFEYFWKGLTSSYQELLIETSFSIEHSEQDNSSHFLEGNKLYILSVIIDKFKFHLKTIVRYDLLKFKIIDVVRIKTDERKIFEEIWMKMDVFAQYMEMKGRRLAAVNRNLNEGKNIFFYGKSAIKLSTNK